MAQIVLAEGSAPATPASGKSTLYVKADGLYYSKDDAGMETLVSSAAGVADGATLVVGLTFPADGLHILDTNATHDLIITPGSNLTADRVLTITTGDAARTFDISAGSVTISAFGATLTDDADASTARTTLGLGTLATQSGTFSGTSSGTNTGDQSSVSGNAGTATALATPRTINGVSFDGTANITVTAAGSTLSDTVTVAKGGTGLTAIGTALQVLRTNAGATALEYATLAGGGNAQTADPLSQFAATTSAQLAGVISDETGTDKVVFNTSPTLVTPLLGTPTSGVLTNCTGLPTGGIVDAAVTLAKMADLAQDQFIGRTTASTGVPQTATITAAARTVLDDTTVGAMVDTLGGASSTGTGGIVRGTSPTITTPTISGAVVLPDDVRQTFNPGTTNAGLNVGAIAGDPSTPSNGDLWYDSTANEMTARINGSNVALGAGGGGGVSASSNASLTISGTDGIVNANWLTGCALINGHLVASAVAGVLTIAVKNSAGDDPSTANPVKAVFRSATATDGALTVITLTAANSFVISSGSNYNFVTNIPGRVWVVAFNDSSTFRLGGINCLSIAQSNGSGFNVTAIYPLRDDVLASSTAEGGAGAADGSGVIYTGTAVTSKAMRVLGYLEWSSGMTAGTWIAPTKIQLFQRGISLPNESVQYKRSDDGGVATGTTTAPIDDTIVQNTEASQFMAMSITPTSSANVYRVHTILHLSFPTSGSYCIAAIFQDSTANSLALSAKRSSGSSQLLSIPCEILMLTQTVSSTTFNIRGGCNTAGTVTFNGEGGARYYGGVFNSYVEVEEIMG